MVFKDFGHLGDLWHLGMVDINPGNLAIGFEGLAQAAPSPAIAVDDVQLVEGSCIEHGRSYYM